MLKGAARNKHRKNNDTISERISQAIFSEEGLRPFNNKNVAD